MNAFFCPVFQHPMLEVVERGTGYQKRLAKIIIFVLRVGAQAHQKLEPASMISWLRH